MKDCYFIEYFYVLVGFLIASKLEVSLLCLNFQLTVVSIAVGLGLLWRHEFICLLNPQHSI